MKILVVDEDATVVQALQRLFSQNHYAVDIASDGETALTLVEVFAYDLMVLDLMLPKLDGLTVCRRLRSQGHHLPILLLTGQGGAEQQAKALHAGADDYVLKPFDSKTLMARVQALLRRGGTTTPPILAWGDLQLDPTVHRVCYGIYPLTLTPKEYIILELLLRQPEKIWNAQRLLDQGWNSLEAPGTETIRVHIKEVRRKLLAAGAPEDFIKTLHGVGYQINPLYGSHLGVLHELPQAAELKLVKQELRRLLEQLQLTQAELQEKNQALEVALNQLDKHVEECTVSIKAADQMLEYHQSLYQVLFDSIDQGVCLFERLPRRADGRRDYRYLTMNLAMQVMFGIPDLSGQSIRDHFPNEVEDWYDDYDRVLETGQAMRFERESKPQGMVLEMFITRVEDRSGQRLLAMMRNITSPIVIGQS